MSFGVMPANRRDRAVLVMHVEARLVAPADDAADQHQRMLAVLRPIGRGDDDAGGVIGLDAAIEEVQRLADKAAVDHVFDRKALLVIGLGIVRGMARMEHLHMRDLLRRRAVIVHVPHKGGGKALPGALPAIGAVVQHVAPRRGAAEHRAGAADADLAEKPFIARKIATTLQQPASMRSGRSRSRSSASVDEPPPTQSM